MLFGLASQSRAARLKLLNAPTDQHGRQQN